MSLQYHFPKNHKHDFIKNQVKNLNNPLLRRMFRCNRRRDNSMEEARGAKETVENPDQPVGGAEGTDLQ